MILRESSNSWRSTGPNLRQVARAALEAYDGSSFNTCCIRGICQEDFCSGAHCTSGPGLLAVSLGEDASSKFTVEGFAYCWFFGCLSRSRFCGASEAPSGASFVAGRSAWQLAFCALLRGVPLLSAVGYSCCFYSSFVMPWVNYSASSGSGASSLNVGDSVACWRDFSYRSSRLVIVPVGGAHLSSVGYLAKLPDAAWAFEKWSPLELPVFAGDWVLACSIGVTAE